MIDHTLVVNWGGLLRVWEGQGQVANFGLQGGICEHFCVTTERRLCIIHRYRSGYIVFTSLYFFTLLFVPHRNAIDLHLRRLWLW